MVAASDYDLAQEGAKPSDASRPARRHAGVADPAYPPPRARASVARGQEQAASTVGEFSDRAVLTAGLGVVLLALVALLFGGDGRVVAVLAGLGGGLAAAATMLRARPPAPAPSAPPGRSVDGFAPGVGRAVLERLPSGLLLLDGAGKVTFQNAAAEDVIERSVIGLSGAAALRAPALTEAIAAALEEGRSTRTELTLHRAKERVIEAFVLPAPETETPSPGAPRVMVMLEDRTRIAKAEALRRDFVANASHELKTPLASISGFIETLQGHAKNDPEASARFLAIMARQTERMKRLVDDLLSLNRIEINEHVRPREQVDLGGLVWEVASALTPLAEAEGSTIVVEAPREGPVVLGSRDELQQVFVNLIDNAVKYAGRDGPIRVLLADPGVARPGMLGVTVADSGPGIAREHLPRLTERFYRVDVARSRERGGTGLGLAIAKHICNRHRGDLTVASTVGEGSRFTVWLPTLRRDDRAA
jgi:two-component system phosphate regulon sensor histidine kinase PhoR